MKFRNLLILLAVSGSLLVAQGGGHGGGHHGGGHGGNHGGGHGGGNHGGGHHGGGHGGGHGHFPGFADTLDVSGLVVTSLDTTPCDVVTQYALDVDMDDTTDYPIMFGPEWYSPESGAVRPMDGDTISIVAGLIQRQNHDVLVVFELNGLQWIPLNEDGEFEGYGPPPADEEITVTGFILLEFIQEGHHPRVFLDEDNDGGADYGLGLRGWAHHDSTAFQPDSGQYVEVTGNLRSCEFNQDRIHVTSMVLLEGANEGDALAIGDNTLNEYRIKHNSYPNPFNPTVQITYEVKDTSPVTLSIYDLQGNLVKELVRGHSGVGAHRIIWDAKDSHGKEVSTGMYIYRIQQGHEVYSGKLSYLK